MVRLRDNRKEGSYSQFLGDLGGFPDHLHDVGGEPVGRFGIGANLQETFWFIFHLKKDTDDS